MLLVPIVIEVMLALAMRLEHRVLSVARGCRYCDAALGSKRRCVGLWQYRLMCRATEVHTS